MIQFQNESLTVFQSALFQTTCTVAVTKDLVIVVDPNWLPHEIEEIKEHVARVKGRRDVYLLFTHGDFDHIIGYHAFPDAKVIGSKGLHEHPQKEQKLELIQQFYNEYYIVPPYEIGFPKVDYVICEDGQQLVLGDTTLTFYLAEGHTHDGLFTLVEPLGLWVAGDYLSNFELPFIYYSAKAYEETLQKAGQVLFNHKVSVMVPGHGQTTSDQEEIKRRIQLSQDYLARLIAAVVDKDLERQSALEKELPFRSNFTKECHRENVELVRKEYAGR
ncbi:MBL fold metallo-hydrolase [Neobacillus vireti]|uniref:MBL fold metallo-hydrolase n=1 Tax=Neobacillus vireti TaxID=220686 RepID=UPI002FFE3828